MQLARAMTVQCMTVQELQFRTAALAFLNACGSICTGSVLAAHTDLNRAVDHNVAARHACDFDNPDAQKCAELYRNGQIGLLNALAARRSSCLK